MFKNKWKVAFFSLLFVVIAVLISLVFIIFQPIDKSEPLKTASNREAVPFNVQTNKADLTKLINYYLAKEGLNGPIHYEINIKDEVELYGSLPVFNTNIQMKLTFTPEALDNGDLILKQKEISVGQLPLPVSYVMNFIKNKYKLPEWVDIQPEEEEIYAHLTKMNIANGLKVKVNQFDLEQDVIQFDLLLPVE